MNTDGVTFYSNLEMVRQYIPENAIASHGRNQVTKRFLYLIVRINGEGTSAHCFLEKNSKRIIRFNVDHIYTTQDVQAIPISFDKSLSLDNRFLLQSTTISEGDQEILLKT